MLVSRFLGDLTATQHNLPLCHLSDFRIMGDDHERRALFMQFLEKIHHNLFIGIIQISGRLVRQDNFRMIDQRPCHADPLLLTAGELAGKVMRSVSKTDAAQCFQRFFFIRHAVIILRQHHIFKRSQILYQVELLKNQPDFISSNGRQILCVLFGNIHAI